MTVTLPQLDEVHSGDLSSPCPKRLLLKSLGKVAGEMPGAMYRGSLADAALDDLHDQKDWTEQGADNALAYAIKYVDARTESEGREYTDAVRKNRGETANEVSRALVAYGRRLGPFFDKCTVIGTQLPIRWTYAGGPKEGGIIDFASHLDLLFRDPDGVLWIWDHKWSQFGPTRAYLARWPQGMMYTLCVRFGSVLIEDKWTSFDEWPQCAWCHLPGFKKYGRATRRGDTDYKAGEERPMDAIVMPCGLLESRADDMTRQLVDHVRMLRFCISEGIYPSIPDPQGCRYCPAEDYCSRFDSDKTNYDV